MGATSSEKPDLRRYVSRQAGIPLLAVFALVVLSAGPTEAQPYCPESWDAQDAGERIAEFRACKRDPQALSWFYEIERFVESGGELCWTLLMEAEAANTHIEPTLEHSRCTTLGAEVTFGFLPDGYDPSGLRVDSYVPPAGPDPSFPYIHPYWHVRTNAQEDEYALVVGGASEKLQLMLICDENAAFILSASNALFTEYSGADLALDDLDPDHYDFQGGSDRTYLRYVDTELFLLEQLLHTQNVYIEAELEVGPTSDRFSMVGLGELLSALECIE